MFTPSLPLLKHAYGQCAIGAFSINTLEQIRGQLADLTGNGKLDIISKPLHGPHIWHILAFENLG